MVLVDFIKYKIIKSLFFKYVTTIVLTFICINSTFAQKSVALSAPQKVGEGEIFYINITVNNINAQPSVPSSIPGGKIQYFTMKSSESRSIVDSHGRSSSVSRDVYAITVKAEKEGSYVFGPVTVGGVTSNKVSYKISKVGSGKNSMSSLSQSQIQGTANPSLITKGGRNFFVVASVDNVSPFEQQAVVYTVKLYTTYSSVFDLNPIKSQSFANCTYEASTHTDHSFNIESYKGKQYRTAVISRYIVYPTHSGKTTFTGNTYTGSVAAEDLYSSPDFGVMPHLVTGQVDATSNDVSIDVRPLPDNPYGNNINGIGQYNVTSELKNVSFKRMQAFTIVYRVTGVGNLSFVSLPDLANEYPSALKFIKSDDKIDKKVGSQNVNGSVTFTCTIIPQEEGEFEIPAIDFIFFNPTTGKYQKGIAKGYKIKVGRGELIENADQKQDIEFDVKLQAITSLEKSQSFMIETISYWMCYLIPLVLLCLIVILYKYRIRKNTDVIGLKNRRAGKVALKRLRNASRSLRQNEVQQFYDDMLNSLWGYLSDKLTIPTSELNRGNIVECLDERGLDKNISDSLIGIIDECEMAKYYSTSGINMHDVYEKGINVINSLEKSLS